MCNWNDDQRAEWGDFWYMVLLFVGCCILFLAIGAVTDGTLAAWLLTLRLPAGW